MFRLVDIFAYLRSVISWDWNLKSKILRRILKDGSAFDKLELRVWSDRGIIEHAKTIVYLLVVCLYPPEAWMT